MPKRVITCLPGEHCYRSMGLSLKIQDFMRMNTNAELGLILQYRERNINGVLGENNVGQRPWHHSDTCRCSAKPQKALPCAVTSRAMDLPQSVRMADVRQLEVTEIAYLVRIVLHKMFGSHTWHGRFAHPGMSDAGDTWFGYLYAGLT